METSHWLKLGYDMATEQRFYVIRYLLDTCVHLLDNLVFSVLRYRILMIDINEAQLGVRKSRACRLLFSFL